MSRFDRDDLPPELSEIAEALRSHRHEASALEMDQAKTRILKRGSGRRVARGGVMRKRTLVTALIMFAAIGTGTAGAFSFGALSFLPSIGVPPINVPVLGNLFGGGGTVTPPVPPAPPSASCAQYGCATTLVIRCPTVVIRGTIPATCTAFVDSGIDSGPGPTGTVTFTSQGQTATCTLSPGPTPGTSSCSVTLPITAGLFIPVNASYSGAGTTYLPSSGSTVIVVSA